MTSHLEIGTSGVDWFFRSDPVFCKFSSICGIPWNRQEFDQRYRNAPNKSNGVSGVWSLHVNDTCQMRSVVFAFDCTSWVISHTQERRIERSVSTLITLFAVVVKDTKKTAVTAFGSHQSNHRKKITKRIVCFRARLPPARFSRNSFRRYPANFSFYHFLIFKQSLNFLGFCFLLAVAGRFTMMVRLYRVEWR